MTFLYPLGLLGLIGVPIIVLIYILKNKYVEQVVPSTYLWTLSERFFKRRNPLSGLTGIISLILQLLTVIIVSFAIARPIFIIPDSAGEYCFVLDGSGSMAMESGGKSRFERGQKEIERIIEDAKAGSTFTLVSVADETTVIYEGLSDKKPALQMLKALECADGSVTYSDAIAEAQECFNRNPSFMVYLITDRDVSGHENVEVINVRGDREVNYSLSETVGVLMGGELAVSAKVVSHTADETLKLELYLDGGEKPAAQQELEVTAGEAAEVTLTCKTENYQSFRLVIANKDSLAADNEFIGYNLKNESSYKIMLISETPFFLQAALDVLTDAEVVTVSPDQYRGEEGYGLYIFQSYTPDALPDGAVWLIDSDKNVDQSGFGARGVVELDTPGELVISDSTATAAKKLLEGVDGKDLLITEYVKYGGMYTKFTTLFSYDSNPLIFAGLNGMGNRQVVIGFDLHRAHFALSTDFIALLGNLLAYSCPDVIPKADYVCGEDVEINVTASIKNVKALAPDGREIYVDTATDIGALHLDQVGTYTVKMLVSGVEKQYQIYSASPAAESAPVQNEGSFSLAGEQEFERSDGEFDPITILFICLALIFIADWMVYCYEKYQLR